MKYQDTLVAYGLSEDSLSRPIKKRIKELLDFEAESKKLTGKINAPNATEDFKKNANKTLEEVRIDMAELDAEIATMIERNVANKERNQKLAATLRDKKAAKKIAGLGAAASSEPPPPEPPAAVIEEPVIVPPPPAEPVIIETPAIAAASAPVVDTPPPAAPPAAEPPTPAPVAAATEKKEGSFGWGWLIGAAVVVIGAFVGVRAMNKNS